MNNIVKIRNGILQQLQTNALLSRRISHHKAIDAENLKESIPSRYAQHSLTPMETDSDPFINYNLGNEYQLRVVTPRSKFLHSFKMRSRNVLGRMLGVGPSFCGHSSPTSAVRYQFGLLQDVHGDGGHVVKPEYYSQCEAGALLITTNPTTNGDVRTVSSIEIGFKNGLHTLKLMHDNNWVHGDLMDNIRVETPESRIILTNPLGNAFKSRLPVAAAYDLAILGAAFTPYLGSWSVASEIHLEYPDDLIEKIPPVISLITALKPNAESWALQKFNQAIRSHIEYEDPEG